MRIHRLRAFSEHGRGGNPAGVVFSERPMTPNAMQDIAKEVGFSETAFFLPAQNAPYRLRFFTPTVEVPLCGHASVAAFNLLRDLGKIDPQTTRFETGAGILEMRITDNKAFLELAPPQVFDTPSIEDIAEMLRIAPKHIVHPPRIVSTGIKELFVGVDSLTTLARLAPSRLALIEASERLDIKGVYVFTEETLHQESDAQGRNFLPALGIDEESATGTAAGALAYYFYRFLERKTSYRFEQGHTMDCPSALHVLIENSRGLRIFVGGEADEMEEDR